MNMKTIKTAIIATAITAVIFSISGTAQAEPFVSAKGGVTIAQSKSTTFPWANLKGDTSFVGSVEAGYQFGQVGVEGQLLSGKKAASTVTGFVNGTYDVLSGSVRPYVIVGVGTPLKNLGAAGSAEYQAGAGVKVNIAKNVDIDGRVTYLGTRGAGNPNVIVPLVGANISF